MQGYNFHFSSFFEKLTIQNIVRHRFRMKSENNLISKFWYILQRDTEILPPLQQLFHMI